MREEPEVGNGAEGLLTRVVVVLVAQNTLSHLLIGWENVLFLTLTTKCSNNFFHSA